jgi:hypothetical protein
LVDGQPAPAAELARFVYLHAENETKEARYDVFSSMLHAGAMQLLHPCKGWEENDRLFDMFDGGVVPMWFSV